MTPTCARCGRELADGAYVCTRCTDRVRVDLLGDDRRDDRPGLVDTAPAARDIAMGLSAHGEGGASGKPGSRMPLDLSATAKLDAVQGEVTTWARHVAEERSGGSWVVADLGADPISQAAQFLAGQLEWLRHRPEADEAFAALEACARVVRGIVRGPAEQRYLGPCGALVGAGEAMLPVGDGQWEEVGIVAPCDGDVYVRGDARTGRCKTCGAEVDRGEREAWLDGEVRGWAYRASEIASAYQVNVNTIRSWAKRGQLAQHGEDREGRPLYNLGDVLDLAAADAARREENRAKRARRMEQRSGEEAA